MLLFREVYGWLRYLVTKDPLCNSYGVVVEEIYSTFAPLSDANDGVRTLVIHKAQDGLTPRIEFRAIGLHPQIYWYPEGASEGTLVGVANQFGFTGDYKSWDCSDLCQYLLLLAKDKFCVENEKNEDEKVVASTIIDFPVVKRILDAVERASQKGTRLTGDMVNKWLKENKQGDLMDFALSVMHWFDKGKIQWKEIDYLEDEYSPGKDIIDWSWLKRQLNTEDRMNKLPPPIADRVVSSAEKMSVAAVQSRFDNILRDFSRGKQISASLTTNAVRLGISAISHFKEGNIPFHYLQQLEICDPYETVLPWSFVRRNVLSYSQGVHAATADSLPTLILSWLKDSHLLILLYKGDANQEDALRKALEAQLTHHIDLTLTNDAWMKSMLSSLALNSVADMKRSLQVEFDLWLLDALSPAIKQWKLPLSPHAFSIEQKDQEAYGKMYKAWEKIVKEYLISYREDSGKRLLDALTQFYSQLISMWKTEELKEYKAKIPSATKILDAVEKGNLSGLLDLLCEDFENEVGSKMPQEIKTKLLASPYFNAISREVKVQGML